MVNVVVFLAMVVGLAVVVGLVAFAGTFALGRLASRAPRSDEVLPSHYSSLVETKPSKFPGYCPECGTNNDAEYSVCRNCSSTLPKSRHERRNQRVNSILQE